jgi:hypothetical protein
MKAVVIHVDPSDGSLKVSTNQSLALSKGSLEVVSLNPTQLASLSKDQLAGRITGTVFGLLKAMYGHEFRPPYNYAEHNAPE